MKKYIFVMNAMELLERLMNGKRVEGVLFMDEDTGKLTFKAYNRQSKKRQKDQLIKKLPWGWVKESVERFKLFVSVPKDVGLATTMVILDEETLQAKDALIDHELDLTSFFADC